MPANTNPNTGIGSPAQTYQYMRNFQLIVTDANQNSIDLSPLHCKFSIKQSTNQTPNSADIRVYNLSQQTASLLSQNFAPTYSLIPNTCTLNLTGKPGSVVLQAGYDVNYGVIFKGNIKQIILGRESATDTFVDFNCGDGDFAYNYAITRTSIKGASQADIFKQISQPMNNLGVSNAPTQPAFNTTVLPRGKVLWGDSTDKLRSFAHQNGLTWSIQDGQIQFIKQTSYAPGVSVILTSKTGMIGTPQQTNFGINVVCLINPKINPGQTIKVDNASVAGLKIDLNSSSPANLPPPLNLDGVYYVLLLEHTGDNRGVDWYSKLICQSVKASAIPINSVSVNYGP